MPRPRTELEPHVAPTAAEHAAGDVIYCDGCSLSWATRFAVPRLKKCRNCARTFWRESQKAHRLGAEVRPVLRNHAAEPLRAPAGMDVDAFLAELTSEREPAKRRPRVQEEKHDPNESIESIVARMGREVTDMPVLLASLDEEEGFIDATLAADDEDA